LAETAVKTSNCGQCSKNKSNGKTQQQQQQRPSLATAVEAEAEAPSSAPALVEVSSPVKAEVTAVVRQLEPGCLEKVILVMAQASRCR